MKFTRRNFLKVSIAAMGAYLVSKTENIFPPLFAKNNSMPKRILGKTGYQVGIFSLGGQATLEQSGTEKESIEIINRAIDLGVNYIDTAAAYGRGISETYIGKVMKDRRHEVFLATKTHDRSYDGSMKLLEKSLKQLQTNKIDLWQLHNVRTVDDLKKIFANDGAIKALEEARSNGIVRYLGITGHYDPWVLKKAIDEYDFDCILMALNAADRHNKSFIDNLLPFAVQKNLGIIGMKIPARGRIFRPDGITTMKQAMEYVLTLPVSTIIVGISNLKELEENVRIAKNFKPLTKEEMKHLEDLTKNYFDDAAWFKNKW
ncbi:MAG: aldo/keto reductase [Ignavibacteria bacterium]|nr:aldo/keto reductase [Ignavibacteria bacterium]